jgi:HAD superfamily hydrolase (TIGR01490 family)
MGPAGSVSRIPADNMSLAIFDLDETLISIDSDHAWGEFICELGLVDRDQYRARNDAFYEDYKQGQLDVRAYLRFACGVLARYPMNQLVDWRQQFVETVIEPAILPAAVALVNRHRRAGDYPIVITSTQRFITETIVERFGIETLIAPEPEIVAGRFTGEVVGVPSFGQGKVTRLNAWLADHGHSLKGSYFYSDSRNDLPLLRLVDHPVAVDPDETLRQEAEQKRWPIITLREQDH